MSFTDPDFHRGMALALLNGDDNLLKVLDHTNKLILETANRALFARYPPMTAHSSDFLLGDRSGSVRLVVKRMGTGELVRPSLNFMWYPARGKTLAQVVEEEVKKHYGTEKP